MFPHQGTGFIFNGLMNFKITPKVLLQNLFTVLQKQQQSEKKVAERVERLGIRFCFHHVLMGRFDPFHELAFSVIVILSKEH